MDVLGELVEFGKKMIACRLVVGPGGNISAREGDCAYLSPSGLSLAELSEDDYVTVEIESGEVVKGHRRPTSETPLHLECYRKRDDVKAVIHAHPPIATGLVTGGVEIKAMTPDFVAYVGKVVTLPYIVPAGDELAEAVGKAISRCNAIMMVNHGAITVGANLKEAFIKMEVLEDSAKLEMAALIAGKPKFFTEEEIEAIDNLSIEAYRRKLLKEGG
jgi:L-fuculose-phosphate aldolase